MRQIYRVTIVLLALLLLSSCGVDVPLAEPIVPTLQPTASMPTPTLAAPVPIVTGVTAAGAVDVNTPVPPIIVVVEPEVIPTEPVVEPPTPVTMQLHQQILSEDLLTWIIEQRQAGQTLEQVASELAAVDLLFDVDANHLHTNGAKAYSEVDSSGNGVPFWAISLYRWNNTENNLAELWLIGENNLEIAFSDGHGEAPPLLLSSLDFTGDNIPDYLFQQMNCGAHTCYGTYRAMSHHNGVLVDAFNANSELAREVAAARPQVGLSADRPDLINMSLPTIQIEDLNGDGVADVRMRGGMISSAGAGVHQGFYQLWSWQGSDLALVEFNWDYTGFRHHELYDGNYAFALGEREIALAHYLRVIYDNSLSDNYVAGEEVAEVGDLARQIAGFRLLMLAEGWERSWLDYLLETYPGEPVTLAAELYLQSREDRLSDEISCGLVAEFLLGQEDPLGPFDGGLGYGNPDIDAENLCQPAPERNQEAQRPLLWQEAQPSDNEMVTLVVEAVLNHDGLALGNLAQIIERPCAFEDGLVMLRCEDDEEAGDLIATLLMGRCEGYYFRVSDAEPLDLTSFLVPVVGLYGVATDMHSGGFAITFATDEIIGDMTLIGDENGVHSFIWFGCATVGTRLLQNAPGGVMLAPREPTGRSLRGY